MKSLVIVAEDKVGVMADVSYILGKAHVNIESVNATVVGGKGVISLTVKDAAKAEQVLKANAYQVLTSDLLVLRLTDEPGALADVSRTLADNGVSIGNVHMLAKDAQTAVYAFKVDHLAKAKKLLASQLLAE